MFSLTTLRQDPDFAIRFEKKAKAMDLDKKNLVSAAKEYTQRFSDEINEGTQKKKLLIEDGKRRGKTEKDVLNDLTIFIPSADTPIMNFLYFISKETEEVDRSLNILREQYNKEYGHLEETYSQNKEVVKDTPEMFTFIYGNMTNETFQKIKKLKALSQSDNPNEASAAFLKCRELCKTHGLEYDKIPSI